MNANIQKITDESIKKVISEMDLVPTDRNGEPNLVNNQSLNVWRMIYRLMDNVKVKMDADYQAKNGRMAVKDAKDAIEYINNAINNILRNTIQ